MNTQSTPQSAARSKDPPITSLQVHKLNPWMARDIEKAKECDVDLMLRSLLSDCMVNEAQTKEEEAALFNKCLKSVLSIGDSSEIKVTSGSIVGSRATNEADLCLAFAGAANTALAQLRKLTIDGLRGASDKPSDKLAFYLNINGDRKMEQFHQTEGAQVLHLIVGPELMPITKLDGDELLKCWWDTVKCHLALWKNDVHHRDVSPSNLMYKDKGGVVGVLIDYDLATIEEGVTGNERIGTVPFMAMVLLIAEEFAAGIKHVYAHDAESFIWVLLWISIRYDSGNLRNHQWLKGHALSGCAKKKLYFLLHPPKHRKGSQGQERNLRVVAEYLQVLVHQYYRPSSGQLAVRETADESFRKLLFDPLSQLVKAQPADFPDFRFENL